jgi:hypothetical protein
MRLRLSHFQTALLAVAATNCSQDWSVSLKKTAETRSQGDSATEQPAQKDPQKKQAQPKTPAIQSAGLDFNNFASDESGAVMGLATSKLSVLGQCLNAELVPISEIFTVHTVDIANPNPNLQISSIDRPYIVRSSNPNGLTVVLISNIIRGDSVRRPWLLFAYDHQCNLLWTRQLAATSGNHYRDLEIDDLGKISLVITGEGSEMLFLQFSSDGTELRNERLSATFVQAGQVVPARGGSGLHLTIDRQSGQGVVSFQGNVSEPIFYRRFSPNGSWIDSQFRPLLDPVGAAGHYDSHEVGINQKGEFVIVHQSRDVKTLWATLFSSSGSHVTTLKLSDSIGLGWDAYAGAHARILSINDEFLIPFAPLNLGIDQHKMFQIKANGSGFRVLGQDFASLGHWLDFNQMFQTGNGMSVIRAKVPEQPSRILRVEDFLN